MDYYGVKESCYIMMKNSKKNLIPYVDLLSEFLLIYLPEQRGLSVRTIVSYKENFKLFHIYLEEKQWDLNKFRIEDISPELILDYLSWYQEERSASANSRNQRLAAFKSFAHFIELKHPEYKTNTSSLYQIKAKHFTEKEIEYLTIEQTKELLSLPDISEPRGLTHKTILTLLYESACRVQELCDLCIDDYSTIDGKPTLKLKGKGSKDRKVDLGLQAAKLLSAYIQRNREGALTFEPLIVNEQGEKYTRSGITYIVKKYARIMEEKDHSFPKSIHSLTLRHSKAVHMLELGSNSTVIREFLGHENIETTQRYSKVTRKAKEEALHKLEEQFITDDSCEKLMKFDTAAKLKELTSNKTI